MDMSWGQIGHLTGEQQRSLDEFLAQCSIEELLSSKFKAESFEGVGLRFLRARNFSVENALILLRESAKRRTADEVALLATLSADSCANCNFHALKSWYPHGFVGYDKQGRPVIYEQPGRINPAAIFHTTTMEFLLRIHWWNLETTLNNRFDNSPNRKSEIGISTFCIVDMAGLGSTQCSSKMLELLKALITLDNTCFPELLGKMIVINAPWIAVQTWEVVKRWLDGRTQDKIEILGSDQEKNRQRILEFVDEEQLSCTYGGQGPPAVDCHQNAGYVHIPRSQCLMKAVYVPAGKKLLVDCYLTDGELLLEVMCLPPTQYDTEGLPLSEEMNKSEVFELLGNSDTELSDYRAQYLLSKSKLTYVKKEDSTPLRDLQEYAAAAEDRVFVVVWTNSAMLVGRNVSYVLSVL